MNAYTSAAPPATGNRRAGHTWRKGWVVAVATAALMATTAACGASTPSGPAAGKPNAAGGDNITVVLGNSPARITFTASAYMLAIDNGFFAKNGIEKVTIQTANDSGTAARLVGTGNAEFGGSIATAAFVPIADAGSNLTLIGRDFPDLAEAVIAKSSSGIHSVADLKEKTVGFGSGSPQGALFPAYLKAAGLASDSVKVANIATNGQYQLLQAGRVDAIATASVSAIPNLKRIGLTDLTVLPYSDQKLTILPGLGMFASNSIETSNPDLVRRYLKAMSESFQFAIANPDAAYASLQKRNPEVTREAFDDQANPVIDQFKTTTATGKSPLYVDPAEWKRTLNVLSQGGLVKDIGKAESYYNSSFLPANGG